MQQDPGQGRARGDEWGPHPNVRMAKMERRMLCSWEGGEDDTGGGAGAATARSNPGYLCQEQVAQVPSPHKLG